jgi:hypothetical protein
MGLWKAAFARGVLTAALAVLACITLSACSPLEGLFGSEEPLLPGPEPGPGPSPTPTEIVFSLPASGSTVTVPVWLQVAGGGLATVRFLADGVERFADTSAPFEWLLDPANFAEGRHAFEVSAEYDAGVETRTFDLILRRMSISPMPPGDIVAAIGALGAGEWFEIPATNVRAVAPSPLPEGDFRTLITAWNGGAYDTSRDRLIVWGGGHADYAGNEVYAFSMKTFQWMRLTDPSPFAPGDGHNANNRNTHPDGRPVSRHTYDYIEYIPAPVDRFFCGGGGALWYASNWADDNTYLFDFGSLQWTTYAGTCPAAGVGVTTAVGPDGRVWQYGAGTNTKFASYEAATNKWTVYRSGDGWFEYGRTAEIDPVRNKYVIVGNGGAWAFDLANPSAPLRRLATTGATSIESAVAPGLAYDPVSGKLVAWGGGASVYSLDVSTATWTLHTTRGVNTAPPAAVTQGTYGRFRYCPLYKVFVVVNDVDGNVFVYKHG